MHAFTPQSATRTSVHKYSLIFNVTYAYTPMHTHTPDRVIRHTRIMVTHEHTDILVHEIWVHACSFILAKKHARKHMHMRTRTTHTNVYTYTCKRAYTHARTFSRERIRTTTHNYIQQNCTEM